MQFRARNLSNDQPFQANRIRIDGVDQLFTKTW
jgi:hypothetical protein